MRRAATIWRISGRADIAREMGISRPMVSRLLSEARALGVVEITVHDPESQAGSLLDQLRRTRSIRDGVLVEGGSDDDATNQALSQGAVELLERIGGPPLGGWLGLSDRTAGDLAGAEPRRESAISDICPLVATPASPPGITSPNENVRLMAQQLGAAPTFSICPPCRRASREKQLLCSTEVYRQICRQWRRWIPPW